MSDPAKYRTKEELEHYKDKDPIEQVKSMILKKKILTNDEINNIDQAIKDQVRSLLSFLKTLLILIRRCFFRYICSKRLSFS